MKILFLLDRMDNEGNLLEANVRAVETTPDKLQLRQVRDGQTVLALPISEKEFIPLISFPVNISVSQTTEAEPIAVETETPTAPPTA